jgi:hypothetical protein
LAVLGHCVTSVCVEAQAVQAVQLCEVPSVGLPGRLRPPAPE